LLCLTELLRRMAESPHSLTGAPGRRVIGWPARTGPGYWTTTTARMCCN